jgi:hypothetical protein
MNAGNVYSRTGWYVIWYAGCPIQWQSKLQTEIALSTAEAKYIALSQALRETLPMTNLMKEISVIFPLYLPLPKFIIKVREDSQSCIAMANNPKLSPQTKHIAIKYHHFLQACDHSIKSKWIHSNCLLLDRQSANSRYIHKPCL